jgi:hypothetical protein
MPQFNLIAAAACLLGLAAADFQIYTYQDRAFADNGVYVNTSMPKDVFIADKGPYRTPT